MLQHVTREIGPPQLERCIHFYALLGFERVREPAGIAGRAVWLAHGGVQIHLMLVADAEPQRGHVGIVAEEYDDVVARLRNEGHEVAPRREHWGAPRAYVRDPAGNLVEIMAWAPSTGPMDRAPGRD